MLWPERHLTVRYRHLDRVGPGQWGWRKDTHIRRQQSDSSRHVSGVVWEVRSSRGCRTVLASESAKISADALGRPAPDHAKFDRAPTVFYFDLSNRFTRPAALATVAGWSGWWVSFRVIL